MSSLLPLKPSTESAANRDLEPKLVEFEDDSADQILSAVSSATARHILSAIYDEPTTASEIATKLDSSVQNVSYHLERLEDANLVEIIGTWYSKQGREMDVYGPTNSTLVLFAGAERATPSLATALRRVLGAVSIIGLVSALVHTRWAGTKATPSPRVRTVRAPIQQPEPTLWENITTFSTGPGGFVLGIGLLITVSLFGIWYWRAYLPAQKNQHLT